MNGTDRKRLWREQNSTKAREHDRLALQRWRARNPAQYVVQQVKFNALRRAQ